MKSIQYSNYKTQGYLTWQLELLETEIKRQELKGTMAIL
jgi:hypothetical protein